jgi:hypothetical protein
MSHRNSASDDMAEFIGGLIRSDWRFGLLFGGLCFAGSLAFLPGELERLSNQENSLLLRMFQGWTTWLVFSPSLLLAVLGIFLVALALRESSPPKPW